MFDILHKLVHDVEMAVRKVLSERLADMPDAPRPLIAQLANDAIEVAYPILTKCMVLEDEDLVEVIAHRTLEHQLAIAVRPGLSEGVSDALVNGGHESVIRTLLGNRDARISRATMEFLVEQSKRVDTFQEPILRREELDGDLATRMFMWVSAALRQYILDNYDLPVSKVDDMLESIAVNEIKSNQAQSESRKTRAREMIDTMGQAGMVTPDLLIAALEQGETALFAALFRKLTGLPQHLTLRLLFEGGGEGLAIACRAVDLGKAVFAGIFTVSRKARPAESANVQRETRRVLNLYDQMSREGAREALDRMCRGQDYLAAIRDLELGGARA
ncbi:MAG: DUF2336 domain-containing protein [Hyphomicrobiales bacterium]|nr:DUF2336 domain-containing protein [Hyphomicrobiales bacterium]